MPNITTEYAQAWLETSKLTLETLNTDLETQIADEVFGRLDLDKPASPGDTPAILRSIIAMRYASAEYERHYSEDDIDNAYAMKLWARSERLLEGVINGSIVIEDGTERVRGPSFYPTDDEEPSFTMGQIF